MEIGFNFVGLVLISLQLKLPFLLQLLAQNNEGAQNNAGILEEVLDTLDNLVYIDQCPTTHETRILL